MADGGGSTGVDGEPISGIRGWAQRITEDARFRNAIIGIIIANAIILGLETADSVMATAGGLISALDELCLAVFVVELALKIIAQGWRFFTKGWNLFDFVIVSVSLVPAGQGVSVLRALRVLRVLRLVTAAPRLRRVIEGFVGALPGMGSVFLLMSLIFYVAAVMATNLFGATFEAWFGTVGRSAYSLFQIMTLESWSMGIVRPVMEVHPYAWAFFVPFIAVTTFAVVNLLVGLIVNSMHDAHAEEANAATDEYRDAVLSHLRSIEARLDRLEQEDDGAEKAGRQAAE
ncbi:MAG: ion transporter [Pseudomonadota bacterium]